MTDPAESSSVTLPNGRRVRLRSLRHGELNTVRELCARLSLRTRYLRFHGRWDNPAFRQVLSHTADVISETMRFGVSEVTFVRRGFTEPRV
jgi:hypothetical protein